MSESHDAARSGCAMRFGTATDEATSFAILDRHVEAGGTFIDTAGNCAFWVNGTQGGEWRRGGPARLVPGARR
jgi:aryl-alcohol dehydrogenase-like predicted oxidoreductase